MKRPAFQFYPGDWRKDPELSLCSLRARGLLIELMCAMHESARYGALVKHDGAAWTVDDVERYVRASSSENVAEAFGELTSNGVLKQDPERKFFFSARMVRDEETRARKAAAGKQGGLAAQAAARSRSGAKPDTSSSSSASSSDDKKKSASSAMSTAQIREGYFQAWYDRYPKKVDRGRAETAFSTAVNLMADRLKDDADHADATKLERQHAAITFLCSCATAWAESAYVTSCRDQGVMNFVKAPASWLNAKAFLEDPATWTARTDTTTPNKPKTGGDFQL